MKAFQHYHTIVFDCDGVLLNSNIIKTKAFYHCILSHGESADQAFVDYHVKNGGISRYKKFDYFLKKIVPNLAKQSVYLDTKHLLNEYTKEIKSGLLQCEIAEGLQILRHMTKDSKWFVVSSGDQQELKEIFAMRGLTELFDGGIFGSLDTKDEILTREAQNGNIQQSALFLGDSRYDHEAACNAGLDFIFVYGWSKMKNWTKRKGIKSVKDIQEVSMLVGS